MKESKLKEAATPLIKYLNSLHPHHVVIVTSTGVELLEGKESHQEIFEHVKD